MLVSICFPIERMEESIWSTINNNENLHSKFYVNFFAAESVEEKRGDPKSFLIERAEHTMIWVVKCEPFYQRNTEESANTLRLLRIFRSV